MSRLERDSDPYNYHLVAAPTGFYFEAVGCAIAPGSGSTPGLAVIGTARRLQGERAAPRKMVPMHNTDSDIVTLLQRFIRFESHCPLALAELSRSLLVQRAQPGEQLFRAGNNDARDIFLVNGELKLIADDGRSHLVTANSGAARHPIARLRPRRYTAVAKTAVDYLVIDESAQIAEIRVQPAPALMMDVAEISFEAFQMAQEQYQRRKTPHYR